MKKVCVFFADGFEETEALTTVDLLRRARIEVTMVSITGKEQVESSHGIRILVDALYENTDIDAADMLVLPGGRVGTDALHAYAPLHEKLKKFVAEGKAVAAICAAPEVFGKLGLLDGKRATCYPGCETMLPKAEYQGNLPAVTDGNIITGRAAGNTMDFAASIISYLVDEKAAKAVLDSVCYE